MTYLLSRHGTIVCRDRANSALLLGKIFNRTGERLTPSYAQKKGVRYRYYISVSAMQSRELSTSAVHRVNAAAVEAVIVDALKEAIGNAKPSIDHPAPTDNLHGSDAQGGPKNIIDAWLERVVLHSDRVEVHWRDMRDADAVPTVLTLPWKKASSTRHREILEPDASGNQPLPLAAVELSRLIRSIALAMKWLDDLIKGTIPDTAALAARENRSERSIRMTLSLAFLDPALIKAAAEGRLPRGYGVSRLADLPPAFGDQWKALGLQPNH